MGAPYYSVMEYLNRLFEIRYFSLGKCSLSNVLVKRWGTNLRISVYLLRIFFSMYRVFSEETTVIRLDRI